MDFKCPEPGCDREFASKPAVNLHFLRAHRGMQAGRGKKKTEDGPDTPVECTICHRFYKNPHVISQHRRVAHGIYLRGKYANRGISVLQVESPAAPVSSANLEDAIAVMEVKRDCLTEFINQLKQLATKGV